MQKRQLTTALTLILITFMNISGCQAAPPPLAQLMVTPATAEAMNYRIEWQKTTPLRRGINFKHIEILGDKLVTVDTANMVTVFDAKSGSIQWRDKIGGKHENLAKPVRNNDLLIVSSETRAFIYHINDGNFIKVVTLKYVANTSPVIYENLAIYGTPKGIVFAQDLRSGLSKWAYQMGRTITTNPIMAGNNVVACDAAGEVNLFNPNSGSILWQYASWGRITVEPAATDLLLYVASEDQTLYCLERTSGKVRWKLATSNPLLRSPIALGDIALQWVKERGLVALDSLTGKELWTLKIDATPIQMRRDTIIFFHNKKLLYVDRKDGQVIKSIDIPHVEKIVSERIDGGSLYFARDSGRIMKLTQK